MRERTMIYGALELAKTVKLDCDNDINEAYWQGLIAGLNFALGE